MVVAAGEKVEEEAAAYANEGRVAASLVGLKKQKDQDWQMQLESVESAESQPWSLLPEHQQTQLQVGAHHLEAIASCKQHSVSLWLPLMMNTAHLHRSFTIIKSVTFNWFFVQQNYKQECVIFYKQN